MSITFFIFFTFSSHGYFHCFFAILSAMILSMMVDDIDQLTSLQSSKFFVRHTALSWFSSSASSFMSLPSSAPSIILSSSSAERKFSVFPSSTHVTLPCQLLCCLCSTLIMNVPCSPLFFHISSSLNFLVIFIRCVFSCFIK